MVSDPVTLGGGIMITKGCREEAEPEELSRGLKTPRDSHSAYQRDSIRAGSYVCWSASGFPGRMEPPTLKRKRPPVERPKESTCREERRTLAQAFDPLKSAIGIIVRP
jgi:hypothetical protein